MCTYKKCVVLTVYSLHLQDGAELDQNPFFMQARSILPMSMCPSGHLYLMVLPELKSEPSIVVFCCLSGLPHRIGAVTTYFMNNKQTSTLSYLKKTILKSYLM